MLQQTHAWLISTYGAHRLSSKCLTWSVASKFAFAFIKASTTSGDLEYCAAHVRGVEPSFNKHTRGQ